MSNYNPRITEALQAQAIAIRKRRTIGAVWDNLAEEEVYNQHARLVYNFGCELLQPLGKRFIIDDCNRDALRFLTYYFNQCPKALDPDQYTNQMFKEKVKEYTLESNIMLIGGVGTGKTFLMDLFALYLERTKNPLAYKCASVTEMLNYYKINEHLDYFTYNTGKNSMEGKPLAFCLNDVGLSTQKFYGNDLQVIIDEYFHARNEVYTQYGKRSHITTNLAPAQLCTKFADEYGRLKDRFKTYNIIPLLGESRR